MLLIFSTQVLFDNAGVLKKYDDVESILKEFYEVRLKKYYERKDYLKGKLEAECSKLENQARFILEKIEGKISIGKTSCLFYFILNVCDFICISKLF